MVKSQIIEISVFWRIHVVLANFHQTCMQILCFWRYLFSIQMHIRWHYCHWFGWIEEIKRTEYWYFLSGKEILLLYSAIWYLHISKSKYFRENIRYNSVLLNILVGFNFNLRKNCKFFNLPLCYFVLHWILSLLLEVKVFFFINFPGFTFWAINFSFTANTLLIKTSFKG